MFVPAAQHDEWDEIDKSGEAARLRGKGRDRVSSSFAEFRVESTTSSTTAFHRALELRKGVTST